MKLLFLTSAGLIPETRDKFLECLPKNPSHLSVAFVPTAADLDPDPNPWYVKAARNELLDLGFKVEDVDLKIDPKPIKEKFEKADIIYINGGNTFYLLDWIRKSKVDTYLKDLIETGKPYIGASAGSVLAGPDIAIAGWDPNWDENSVNLLDTTGLGIVPFAVVPHYDTKDHFVVERESQLVDYKVVPLTNTQAVLVRGDSYEIIGTA